MSTDWKLNKYRNMVLDFNFYNLQSLLPYTGKRKHRTSVRYSDSTLKQETISFFKVYIFIHICVHLSIYLYLYKKILFSLKKKKKENLPFATTLMNPEALC